MSSWWMNMITIHALSYTIFPWVWNIASYLLEQNDHHTQWTHGTWCNSIEYATLEAQVNKRWQRGLANIKWSRLHTFPPVIECISILYGILAYYVSIAILNSRTWSWVTHFIFGAVVHSSHTSVTTKKKSSTRHSEVNIRDHFTKMLYL